MTISPDANSVAVREPAATTADIQLYRAMQIEDDGNPRIGPNHLGFRIGTDIHPDDNGNVRPETGGMSVTPNDPIDLPFHRRPIALGGTSKWPVWWINERKLTANLRYRPEPYKTTHGFVEPSDLMSIVNYQGAIEGTALSWILHA
jgi:hypothetical protein